MNTRSVPHISMAPSLSFAPFDIPPTQVDFPSTQVDFEQTQPDIPSTQIDFSPTQIAPSVGLHQQRDSGFLPAVPENVPIYHMGTPRVANVARSSSSVGTPA